MPKTDRQTDKATWWSITAYNDEIALLEDNTKFPAWVQNVYGGREECPTTKRIHFQGALQCSQQVRMSQVKSWLPTAHLEVARAKECLVNYVLKKDTAVGEKVMRENPNPYLPFHEMCILISAQETNVSRLLCAEEAYWDAVNMIIRVKPYLASSLSTPSLRNFWIRTRHTWRDLGAVSITSPADSDTNVLSLEEPVHPAGGREAQAPDPEETCAICNQVQEDCGCDEFYSRSYV